MNAFKRKALTSAVLAGLGVAGTAHAVYMDPNGQGQALIYPYYTVQSNQNTAFNTYLSIVNTTAEVKVVRFRAREGRNSQEVRDFNIYLSPNDMWTAAIVPSGAGAMVITTDASCTSPVLPTIAPATSTTPAVRGIAFTNTLYTASGGVDDGAGTGLDRTREGYIEMLELGVLDPTTAPGSLTVHNPATDTPACGTALLEPAAVDLGNPASVINMIGAPSGGLNGTGTLIHVDTGNAVGYNATALAAVYDAPQFGAIGNDTPSFADAFPQTAIVVSDDQAFLSDFTGLGNAGYAAVSATMMHSNVINEFVLDNATRSQTDWVLTFPTKRGFVSTTAATAPFTNKFVATGACEPIGFQFFNREERGAEAVAGDFSPLPPPGQTASLCWESTVLSIRNGADHMPTATTTAGNPISGVLASQNTTAVTVTAGIQNGWANLMFTGANATGVGLVTAAATSTVIDLTTGVATGAQTQTYFGLPVLGFMVRTLQNTAVTCGPSGCNFGGLFPHKYEQSITSAP